MTSQQKIQWIKQNIIGIEKIDPYTNRKAVDLVKQELLRIGAYKEVDSDTTHQAVINMIMKIKGKYGKVHNASSRQKRKTECYY